MFIPYYLVSGEFHVSKSLVHWINDGLMALFFFVPVYCRSFILIISNARLSENGNSFGIRGISHHWDWFPGYHQRHHSVFCRKYGQIAAKKQLMTKECMIFA